MNLNLFQLKHQGRHQHSYSQTLAKRLFMKFCNSMKNTGVGS